jgi:thioredoxin reductase
MNAAVVLGRCRRKVLLFDTGNQRNRSSQGINNYLTQDGILPADFFALAKKEMKKYGVDIRTREITFAQKKKRGPFMVMDSKSATYYSKKLLIATGLQDRLPSLEGIKDFYGKSVFHCPYCDGWEVRDKIIGVYAKNKNGFELAVSLRTWSKTVTYYTNGKKSIREDEAKMLKKYGIPVVMDRITKLEGTDGKMKWIISSAGERHRCDALFFVNGYNMQSHLVESLGCIVTKKKAVITNRLQQTNIPGVYVAGDASRDMHFVVVAAAEGAKAAVTINKELQKEEKREL